MRVLRYICLPTYFHQHFRIDRMLHNRWPRTWSRAIIREIIDHVSINSGSWVEAVIISVTSRGMMMGVGLHSMGKHVTGGILWLWISVRCPRHEGIPVGRSLLVSTRCWPHSEYRVSVISIFYINDRSLPANESLGKIFLIFPPILHPELKPL